MSMFRSLWNSLKIREGSHSREASRTRDSSPGRNDASRNDSPVVRLPGQTSDFASDSNTDSLLSFYRRQRPPGLDIVLDDRDINHENLEYSSRVIRNRSDYDTMSDLISYLNEEQSTESSRALQIENYSTFASDLKEKVEEPASQSRVNVIEQPVSEADKYKTITIRTLSKSNRDILRNSLMEDGDALAELRADIQAHRSNLHRMP